MQWLTIAKGLACVLVLLVLLVGVGILCGLWLFADSVLGFIETRITRAFDGCYEDWS